MIQEDFDSSFFSSVKVGVNVGFEVNPVLTGKNQLKPKPKLPERF